jgi:hypothetical protein
VRDAPATKSKGGGGGARRWGPSAGRPREFFCADSRVGPCRNGVIALSNPGSVFSRLSSTARTPAMSASDAAAAAAATNTLDISAPANSGLTELPFPPVTKQHILNCSYHTWHPK